MAGSEEPQPQQQQQQQQQQSVELPATKAPKDKNCPYCGQAFTSSSLGRHLDLYIKERNPKPPDGLHDVDEIRKMRGSITRRHPRASLGRRETLTPVGTPTTASRRSPLSDAEGSTPRSPAVPKSATVGGHGFGGRWDGGVGSAAGDTPGGRSVDQAPDSARRPVPTRAVSRHMVKSQFDMKQKIQDALDTSRAAELALRELVSSWKAAKTHIDVNSMPFDFQPLSLDFPALALQCLQTPPTLFSSTQHPTSTSWSILPPGQKQFEALTAYFRDEFQRWKVKCAAATTAIEEDLSYPSAHSAAHAESKEAIKTAEKAAETLEAQVTEHLQSAYAVWEGLPPQRQSELWVLELARGVGRKQSEVDKLKETQQSMKQENAHLKAQIEQLSRVHQPREFSMLSPTTIPMKEGMLDFLHEQSVVHGRKGVAFTLDDRQSDVNTIVARTIDRWKSVIVTARSANTLNAQRPLDQAAAPPPPSAPPAEGASQATGATAATTPVTAAPPPRSQQLQQQPQPQPQQQPKIPPVPSIPQQHIPVPTLQPAPKSRNLETATVSFEQPVAATASPPEPSPVEVKSTPLSLDDTSDLDADAEMDDDEEGYAAMSAPLAKPMVTTAPLAMPMQATPKLEVQRTRGPAQRTTTAAGSPYARSASHAATGAGVRGKGSALSNRSVTNIGSAMQRHVARGGSMSAFAAQPDMSVPIQDTGGGGDPMFMD
ncbi:hypothetical protein GGTG_13736 [Gaeumannomyces tritici R3-111a-1]|uniref:Uncharacterized protein n=1 Tax=Gaeumannomyces tritici (strain R3-111a-1) TaxID=644352 RepID=J3PJP7_GAET3|nr:hypothetical protein GGTG_13736 [Gaeumannomyces tritici R3-111a-1]EJT68697.1 hypothetical protein GGTG_13736 [Gaeumannomyces tritici R3-111a-1]